MRDTLWRKIRVSRSPDPSRRFFYSSQFDPNHPRKTIPANILCWQWMLALAVHLNRRHRRVMTFMSIWDKADYVPSKTGATLQEIFLPLVVKNTSLDGIPGSHSPFARRFIEALRSFGGSDGILTFDEIKVNPSTNKNPCRGRADLAVMRREVISFSSINNTVLATLLAAFAPGNFLLVK